MPTPNPPPENLPDPWLFDSEALLRELDRCRETVLQIPITNPNATHFGIQLAVSAIWNLTENLRYLLHLQPRATTRNTQTTRAIAIEGTLENHPHVCEKNRTSRTIGGASSRKAQTQERPNLAFAQQSTQGCINRTSRQAASFDRAEGVAGLCTAPLR